MNAFASLLPLLPPSLPCHRTTMPPPLLLPQPFQLATLLPLQLSQPQLSHHQPLLWCPRGCCLLCCCRCCRSFCIL
ncbi:hypothetical protein BCR33DRAFT_716702, partial [Rhizoclosmatium globosum]